MIVEFYKLKDGSKPAGLFIKALEDKKLKEKVIRSIMLLEEFGYLLDEPDSKYLGDDIYELRTIYGNNIVRCLYFFTVGDKAIVTNGIIKKTRRTPREIIRTAKKYREDYERRIKDGRY